MAKIPALEVTGNELQASDNEILGASAIPLSVSETLESILHQAVRRGDPADVHRLLRRTDEHLVDINSPTYKFGWTPLILSAVQGDKQMAWLLLSEGADPSKRDTSGWTAAEHAALRGHQGVWKAIQEKSPQNPAPIPTPPETPSASPSLLGASSVDELQSRYSQSSRGDVTPDRAVIKTIETVGHQYLQSQSMILVSLGTMDTRAMEPAVSLDDDIIAAHQGSVSLKVSAFGAQGDPHQFGLPVSEAVSTEPISFKTMDPAAVRLHFDVVRSQHGQENQVIGRAVALLGKIKPKIGSSKVTLQGNLNLPIMAAGNLEVIGQVIFNFSIITPFTHSNMGAVKDRSYWKKSVNTMLIGHRGLGKNQHRLRSLQLGENTIQSFVAAANLGANYVEFDVQLTKDHVPVIYHDFTVSETGIDAPVHTLTLEQFMHISDIQTPRPSRPSSPSRRSTPPDEPFRTSRIRSQSLSRTIPRNDASESLSERMKYTRAMKDKGFKANSRGSFIQAPFTTLSQMFDALPSSTGFNIEVKYPMLSQCEAEEMDAYAVELNSFVDTILTTVFDHAKERPIIFSSFNPDICLLLSFKQPCFPILFLTEAGTNDHMTDIRATSLQEAIKFASRWGLLGIVSAAEPLCLCPRLIKVVKESGLVCITYGVLNNDTEMVRRQVEMGIDGVIVDSVLKVGKGLREGEKEWTRAGKGLLSTSL